MIPLVIIVTIVGHNTTQSVILMTIPVIYDLNIFILEATEVNDIKLFFFFTREEAKQTLANLSSLVYIFEQGQS